MASEQMRFGDQQAGETAALQERRTATSAATHVPASALAALRAARADFPVLNRELRPGVPLSYLDSAATALKPRVVIDAVVGYLADYPANVHRAVHALGERATEGFEGARQAVATFLNAADPCEIVFTRGTTESINLVARSWSEAFLKPGDAVLLTELEHHANLVPWQMAAHRHGLELRFLPLAPDGRLDLEPLDGLLADGRVKLVGVTGMSNVLGTIVPLEPIVAKAHAASAVVLVDAAQTVVHQKLDVQALGADFVAFSGHKLGGPTGIGVLYARARHLEAMPPFLGGGSMVAGVTLESADWNEIPYKFEAGTPPIAEAIGLGAAVQYLAQFDPSAIAAHERALVERAHRLLGAIDGVRLLGPEPQHKGGIVSFTADPVHPHDLASILDRHGVAVRAGQHCAAPLHDRLGVSSTARASFWLYNDESDVDRLAEAVADARRVFGRR